MEVEKTASITKAAENLFMGQPNLSRGIKELEETLGVKIFKRTSKGIVPTPQGEEFLGYAKSILAQIEEMESLYKPEKNNKLKFSISVPRASYIANAFSKFVREADMSKEIEFSFKETNAMRAIRNVVQENYGLAIVRYQTIFESFFTNMLRDKGMKSEKMCIRDRLTAFGCDRIQFLVSANAGEDPKPMSKIASGGELSRIMLAINTVLSEDSGAAETQIFDEIDTGISGEAANKVGIKLRCVSKNAQVICVTHLDVYKRQGHVQ